MMKKIFKGITLGITGLFVTGMMAACNGDETGNNDTAAQSGDVDKITFMTRGNSEELEVYQRAVDSFNDIHDDIHVNFESIPGDNYSQLLITRLQGGQAPDVFYVDDHAMSTMIRNNSVLPVDEFLESDESYVTVDEFPEDIWGPSEFDGVKYGLIPDANPFVMYYNKSVFDEFGLDSPQEYFDRGEWTWDTLEEITDVIREGDKYGYVLDGGTFGFSSWLFNNGGSFAVDNEVTIDQDPQAREALEFVNRMVQQGNFVYSGTLPDGQGRDAMFMSNQVALVGAGRWLAPMFIEADVEFDYIPWPTNSGELMEPTLVTNLFMAANSSTDHPEAALKFMSYYVSQEGQEIRLQDGGNSIPSVEGIEHVVTEDDIPEHNQYLLDAIEIGRPIDFEFMIPGLNTELSDIYELMYIGDITTDEAIERLAEVSREMADDFFEE